MRWMKSNSAIQNEKLNQAQIITVPFLLLLPCNNAVLSGHGKIERSEKISAFKYICNLPCTESKLKKLISAIFSVCACGADEKSCRMQVRIGNVYKPKGSAVWHLLGWQ
jgi:hypothetical protein